MINTKKQVCIYGMSLLMSHLPNVVMAEAVKNSRTEMISTGMVLANTTRAEAEKDINQYLQQEEVRAALLKQGVSVDEVTARLAALSEQEIRQLSGQIKDMRAGGDILVAILLVVLIIFLIQRI